MYVILAESLASENGLKRTESCGLTCTHYNIRKTHMLKRWNIDIFCVSVEYSLFFSGFTHLWAFCVV